MRRIFSKKGQSTLEYAILILIVIVALLAMQTYLKRGVQGRMRESSDNIGEAYSPGYTTSAMIYTSESEVTEVVDGAAGTSVTTVDSESDRTGAENIPAYEEEYWP
ncbi:MAG: hypothetical protein MJA29_06880 [Candidatus Omnitrophica bacterium]|nr:hypothetical protein [Candidatus Omnitrophota bacterium]